MADGPPTKPARNVAYFFDEELCNYNYGGGNPMRPHRHRLTTNLVKGYGLDEKLHVIRPAARTREEIMHFHADGEPVGGRDGRGWHAAALAAGACCRLQGGGSGGQCRGLAQAALCALQGSCYRGWSAQGAGGSAAVTLLWRRQPVRSHALPFLFSPPASAALLLPACRLRGLPDQCDPGEPGGIHDAGGQHCWGGAVLTAVPARGLAAAGCVVLLGSACSLRA